MQKLLRQFLQLESSSGIILLLMAVLAMICANSPLSDLHSQFIDTFHFSINEGLMAVFFLVVGLELKRGFLDGLFSSASEIALPLVAAFGGMVVPAFIYYLINHDNSVALHGWATPVATDIAFALGVLTLFGSRVPPALKLFLLALAIFDDIGAIFIIGIFYSTGVVYFYLGLCIALILLLWLFSRMKVQSLLPYLLVGTGLWVCMLHSGIHPTLAGVILALFIPGNRNENKSPLHRLEKWLHPWVAYFIMPVFALANAGFSLSGMSLGIFGEGVVQGIILGLFIGKQVGIFAITWIFIRLGWGRLPENTSWLEMYGVSLVCGIGFTMSLFLGTLSFQHTGIYLDQVRLGVLTGSILSGLFGAYILQTAFARKSKSLSQS
jgi:NhaA family Na+:H+ antiporter